MVVEQLIKDYVKRISKGVINLNHQQAREIINLVIGKAAASGAVAKLYRHNAAKNCWEFLYSVNTTNEKINFEIKIALESGPVYSCYCWELYNDKGEHEGNIYTVKNQLF